MKPTGNGTPTPIYFIKFALDQKANERSLYISIKPKKCRIVQTIEHNDLYTYVDITSL